MTRFIHKYDYYTIDNMLNHSDNLINQQFTSKRSIGLRSLITTANFVCARCNRFFFFVAAVSASDFCVQRIENASALLNLYAHTRHCCKKRT